MGKRVSVLVAAGAATVFVAAIAGAAHLDIKIPVPPIPKIKIPKPPLPKVKIEVDHRGGPVGRERSARGPRQYQYYPEAQVYFDPGRQLYFFMQANRWLAQAFLPPEIKVHVGSPVVVDLDTDQPYDYHSQVREYYPGRGDDRPRSGYRGGFDEGYEAGYSDGYNAAYRESFDQGYKEGYEACYDRYGYEDRRPARDRGPGGGWERR
jgi:hypothetical protein